MRKVISLVALLVLAFSLTACSSRKPLVYNGNACMEYEELVFTQTFFQSQPDLKGKHLDEALKTIQVDEDGQNLADPELNAHFRKMLDLELAKKGLRMCANGESSEYRLVVTEAKSDIDRPMMPWITVTGIPEELIIDVAGTLISKYGVDAYKAGRGIDYKINNTVTLKQGTGRLAPEEDINFDLRSHFQYPAKHYKEVLRAYYTALAQEIAEDVADIAEK